MQLYLEASGVYHKQQRDLLKEDPEQIKYNLAVAHGMGECLQTILKRIPKEQTNGWDFVRESILGTVRRGDSTEGRGRTATYRSVRKGSGPSSWLPFRNLFSRYNA
jgi:hypothetical protein